MSQPEQTAKAPKKASRPRKAAPVPAAAQLGEAPKSQRKRTSATPTPKPTAPKARAAKASSKPQQVAAPRPALSSGPSQSDFIALAVLGLVVALSIGLFWWCSRHGLTGAVGSSLPLAAAAWPKMALI